MKRLLSVFKSFCITLVSIFSFPVSSSHAAGIVGPITNPTIINSTQGSGLFKFIGNLFSLTLTIAGIAVIFQFITAGYTYISANGDPKRTEMAWAKIWQSVLGLVIIASAFIIAGVVGRFTGIDPRNPTIYGP